MYKLDGVDRPPAFEFGFENEDSRSFELHGRSGVGVDRCSSRTGPSEGFLESATGSELIVVGMGSEGLNARVTSSVARFDVEQEMERIDGAW